MASMDVFSDEAFSMSSLSLAINELDFQPGRLGALGMFTEDGINTTTVQIEKDGDTLALVSAGDRGNPGQIVSGSRRNLIPFNTIHLPQRSVIRADEVRDLRAFGSETELESVQTLVAKRQLKHRRQLEATIEFHRIGAIKGQILDADGKTVLLDLYKSFGLKQKTIAMDLANADTDLQDKCLQIQEAIEDGLGAAVHTSVRVFCGRNFWAALRKNKSYQATFLNSELAAALRGEPREAIEFGGCVFERYRGKVGAVAFVDDDEAYAVPEGVSDLLVTNFAPADHIDTVGTMGLPFYTSQETLPHGKGVDLESQSNPISLCSRPGAVIKLTK